MLEFFILLVVLLVMALTGFTHGSHVAGERPVRAAWGTGRHACSDHQAGPLVVAGAGGLLADQQPQQAFQYLPLTRLRLCKTLCDAP